MLACATNTLVLGVVTVLVNHSLVHLQWTLPDHICHEVCKWIAFLGEVCQRLHTTLSGQIPHSRSYSIVSVSTCVYQLSFPAITVCFDCLPYI